MSSLNKVFYALLLILICYGCQPKVYLMPPPVALTSEPFLFSLSDKFIDENLLYTLYATNRNPYNKFDYSTGYSIIPSSSIRLGYVVFSVGDDDMTWEDLYEQSLSNKRDKDLLLTMKYTRESAEYSKTDDEKTTSSRGEGFFHTINQILEKTVDKDLTIYVHGANSNFYRATAQGAQYHHYTGQNSLILTFSWPSAENLLKYKTDVLHASKSVKTFARLLEILAYHTKAMNINILAYSAGCRIVVPALASLIDLFPELSQQEIKEKLRIGEIYLAAPDTPFQAFVEEYLRFKDIVQRTTINLNDNDSVLRLAAFQDGISRLGKPDLTELSKEEYESMIYATQQPSLNIIDLGNSVALKIGGSHDSWYSHPWVSNDLLLLFLFNAAPEARGLAVHTFENGAKTYYFPENYDKIIQNIVFMNRTFINERVHSEGRIK